MVKGEEQRLPQRKDDEEETSIGRSPSFESFSKKLLEEISDLHCRIDRLESIGRMHAKLLE